jgi:beta-glucosidase
MSGRLPDDFRFGAATAAYQIEGAVREGGRGESIWDRFTREPGRVERGETGDVACDHYHRWREDLDLMARLGVESYRFSIAWPRLFPGLDGRVNEAGVDFYRRLVEGLVERGVEPLATLYHWDLPQVLQDRGGWAERDTARRFAEYASVAYERLGDLVTRWITVNEPWVVAFPGHAQGTKAPGIRDWPTALRAGHHVLLAHGLAVRALRELRPGAQVGITLNLAPVYPGTRLPHDAEAAQRMDGYLNRWFLDPVYRGRYPADMLELYERRFGPLECLRDGDLDVASEPTDFLGVNYYSPMRVRAAADGQLGMASVAPVGARTAMGWEIHPAGLREVLLRLRDDYGNPAVHVTENGASFQDPPASDGVVNDPERTAYLEQHLAEVRRAIDEGANVRGYYVWSLLDNFEWEQGYDKRFGIVSVDFESQRRVPKQSGLWYRDYIDRTRNGGS